MIGGKLGKLAPKHDARLLCLSSFLDETKLPPIPPSIDWSHAVTDWKMLLNQELSCCVVSGILHAQMGWGGANGHEPNVTDADVLPAYEAIGNYRPGDASTDNGCVMETALAYWRNNGVAGNKLGAYLAIGHKDASAMTRLRASVALFGSALLGFALPQCIENEGKHWQVPREGAVKHTHLGDATLGSLGGHCVLCVGFKIDPATKRYDFTLISWGQIYTASQSFLEAYLEESYCALDSLWTDGTKPAPSGLDVAGLNAALRAL